MANTQITSLICNNFGGIRRKDANFSDEKITCSDCQNVELYFTGVNSGVGIRTAKGNKAIHIFDGEEVVGLFESNQGGKYSTVFAYTVDEDRGHLYECDIQNGTYTEISLGNFILHPQRKACGADFIVDYTNYFIFSNGEQIVYLYTDNNPDASTTGIQVDTTQPIDTEGSVVRGLGLKVFNKKLWIFNGHTLYYSYTGNCKNFSTQSSDTPEASAGWIDFTKPITAIHEYLGKLAVFHKNSSCLVSVSSSSTVYTVEDESPGGCASYDALVFHGTDLYFYDDTKKGVFGFSQVVNGDKVLSQNIAEDIQEELIQIVSNDVDRIRSLSVVTEDRNEVWFIVPINGENEKSTVFIFDYIRGEWVKRYSNHINCILVYNADLYSGGNKLYKEYETNYFDNEFIESFYTCSIFNYGTDNTLKITKFPPRLTVDAGEDCDFWIEYVKNYDINKEPKIKNIRIKSFAKILRYDNNMNYDSGYIYRTNTNSIVKLPSVTFKALEMKFETKYDIENSNPNFGFSIKNIEFSKLKVKQV